MTKTERDAGGKGRDGRSCLYILFFKIIIIRNHLFGVM